MVSHLMLYCFGKWPIFRFQSKEMEFYCRGQEECRRAKLMSYLILTVLTVALQVVNAVMFCAAKYKCTTLSCDCNSFPISLC